jgi:hypothetical protein
MVDLALLDSAPKAVVDCGPGYGMAVSTVLGLIVTSCCAGHEANTISAFSLKGHWHLGTWGSTGAGPLQFDFSGWPAGYSGTMCFSCGEGSPCGGAGSGAGSTVSADPLLLVADHGNRRVSVFDVRGFWTDKDPVLVGIIASREGTAPRGVAACAAFIAVSSWAVVSSGDHVVELYDATTLKLVRVLGAGCGCGAGFGKLRQPCGLRFSADGTSVIVADCGNRRMCVFSTSGMCSATFSGMSESPRDVVELASGTLVAADHSLLHLDVDGSTICVLEQCKSDFVSVFVYISSDGPQLIVRGYVSEQFQVFALRTPSDLEVLESGKDDDGGVDLAKSPGVPLERAPSCNIV